MIRRRRPLWYAVPDGMTHEAAIKLLHKHELEQVQRAQETQKGLQNLYDVDNLISIMQDAHENGSEIYKALTDVRNALYIATLLYEEKAAKEEL